MWISVAVADDSPPGFVYGILVTIFLAFNCFALNQWLQYGKGRWADYAHGETAYIWLSLIAKSLLAGRSGATPSSNSQRRRTTGLQPITARPSGSLELRGSFLDEAATLRAVGACIALVIIAASNSPAVSSVASMPL